MLPRGYLATTVVDLKIKVVDLKMVDCLKGYLKKSREKVGVEGDVLET